MKRCAVYTRKSTEEGLEQDFNSLQVQREACEAFIKSQTHEGWRLCKTAYDDGGYSGGSMERPALQQLLADIEARKLDVVVVYKVAGHRRGHSRRAPADRADGAETQAHRQPAARLAGAASPARLPGPRIIGPSLKELPASLDVEKGPQRRMALFALSRPERRVSGSHSRRKPSNFRWLSVCLPGHRQSARPRGGPGRARTCNQTVMSGRL